MSHLVNVNEKYIWEEMIAKWIQYTLSLLDTKSNTDKLLLHINFTAHWCKEEENYFPLFPEKKKLHNLNNACKITFSEFEIIGKSRDFLRHKQIYISVIKGTL